MIAGARVMRRSGHLVGACLLLTLGACGRSGAAPAAAGPVGAAGGAFSAGGAGGGSAAGGSGDANDVACEGVDGGSATTPPYVDLDVTASGFAEHEGQKVFLVTRTDIAGVLGSASATVTGGAFAFHFPKGYKRSTDQEILWLLDGDGDGVCDDTAGDHTGYALVSATDPPAAQSVAIAIADNHVRTTPSNADLCIPGAPFGDMLDIDITGVGFDAHEGRAVHLLTRNLSNGAIFGSGDAVVAGGGFAFHFPRGLERFTYQEIFFFVDADGDGKCTPGTDHPGYTLTPGFNPTQDVPLEMQVMDNHVAKSTRGADVCVVMNGCQLAP
jgi:hypothetical protein